MPPDLDRYADLIVNFGANVQPDQIVDLGTALGKEELTRAITASAYKRGAKFVDVYYWDPHLKRERVKHVAEDALDFVPPWYGERALQFGDERGAAISLSGPIEPRLFDDLDQERLGRDVFPRVKEWSQVINDRTVNWCVAPGPTAKWAGLVYPQLEPDEALDKLWQDVFHVCRLDGGDPVVAWRDRARALGEVAERLTERRFDSIHLEGPGTDLTVGLLPTSNWIGGGDETIDGISHMANLPTEEVFTTPDPERVTGMVRATRPLVYTGIIIEGLKVRFENGHAVQIQADSGGDALRALVEQSEGGDRLGELALVDREGRIGPLETVFYDTLLDENSASHIALGTAYETGAGEADLERINRSTIHIDFMVGSPAVDVTGIMRDGKRVPLLRDATWQI